MPIKKTVMNKTDIYGIETCSYVYRDVISHFKKQHTAYEDNNRKYFYD